MGCDSLTMSPGSQLMIHQAACSVYGNRAVFAEVMDELARMDTSLASLYQARAGGDLADWEAAMENETWYTPQQAVDAGLADHIAEPPNKAGDDDEDDEPANGATGWGATSRRAPAAAASSVKCPDCGKFNKATADVCTECGADMSDDDDGDDDDGDDDESEETDDTVTSAATTTPVSAQQRAAATSAPVPPLAAPAPKPAFDPEVVRAAFRDAFTKTTKEAR
jgi:hypothetical protein